jgi:sec-independent protein translocase protein TatC
MPEDDPNQNKQDTAEAYPDDPYTDPYVGAPAEPTVPATVSSTPPPSPPSSRPEDEEDDEEDEGMLRMSFLEHLEELRSRLIKAFMGLGIAFAVSLTFSQTLFDIVRQPATAALMALGYSREESVLIQTQPTEAFFIIWMKLPLLTAVFLASPWLLYQVWAFVAPGLYKKERRLAGPFILCSAGLFILGGLFAYFVAFRFGLTFLLGVGRDVGVRPLITVTEYFDIFINVILGVGVVFELPVLIFFVILLRLISARFLVAHSRYAVLAIVMIAAVITPTPDVFNLMIFSVPMVVLYFIGIFAGYLLELSRENKKFPWGTVAVIVLVLSAFLALSLWVAVAKYGFRFVDYWPFLVR